jgi:hypothetical protein
MVSMYKPQQQKEKKVVVVCVCVGGDGQVCYGKTDSGRKSNIERS